MSTSESIFIVASQNPASLKIIPNHHLLKDKIIRESVQTYNFNNRNIKLIELEISTDSFLLTEKIKSDLGPSFNIKIVPSKFMTSLILTGINATSSATEIFFALKNIVTGLKKLVLVDDSSAPGLNKQCCFIEFDCFDSAKAALKILNHKNSNLYISNDLVPFFKILGKASQYTETVFWCEPFVDMTKELLYQTKFIFIENLKISLNLNILKLKEKLEEFGKVASIRVYAGKVLVVFSSEENINRIFECPFIFDGKICNVKPAMKSNKNIEKYRERSAKVLLFQLNDEDKLSILNKFYDNSVYLTENLRKKAEIALSRLSHDSDQSRRSDKRNSSNRDRDRSHYDEEKRSKDQKSSYSGNSSKKVSSNYSSSHNDANKNMDRYLKSKRGNHSDSPEKDTSNHRTSSSRYNPNSNNNHRETPSSTNTPTTQTQPTNILPNILSSNINLQLLSGLGLLSNINNNPNLLNLLQQLVASNNGTTNNNGITQIPANTQTQVNPTNGFTNSKIPLAQNSTQILAQALNTSQLIGATNNNSNPNQYSQQLNSAYNFQMQNNLPQNMNNLNGFQQPTYNLNNPLEFQTNAYFQNQNGSQIQNYEFGDPDMNTITNSNSYHNIPNSMNFSNSGEEALKKFYQNLNR